MKAVHLEMRQPSGKYKLMPTKTGRGTRALAQRGVDMAAPLMTRFAVGQNANRGAMQIRRSLDGPGARLLVKRLFAAAIMVGAGAGLGSCAGTGSEDGFSAYVADHWPHWAGGMPSDVPPRPGAPGYSQFIAHGQTGQAAMPAAPGAKAAAVTVGPVVATQPPPLPAPAAPRRQIAPVAQAAPAAPAASPGNGPSEDSSVVPSGLY
jgi:hypothetical protein